MTILRTTLPVLLAVATSAHADDAVVPANAPPAAAAAPVATSQAAARSIVVHVAPAATRIGEPVELEAMIDAPFAEVLTARWRPIGEPSWQDATFERSSAGGWFASLPAVRPPGLEYYIRGTDGHGAEVLHFASADHPHVVRVDPTRVDRLELLDRARLAGRVNQVAVDVSGHDFGNRYDIRDRFLRGELTYTHRLLRQIHHIAFGFGVIGGRTPEDDTSRNPADDVYNGQRYGFGEVRLRAHPSLFIDLRVALGVSQDGFDQAARGQVIFGKPWRSSVAVGAEMIGDLGPTAWVRLQWDTAPPFLMGASIVRTDLPGSVVDAAGLYIAYDVAYQLAQRFTIRGQVSYGARDGSAHLGGGLGTAVDFSPRSEHAQKWYVPDVAISLSVNLNKVALLRNSRGATNPSPEVAGAACLDHGAYGLTLHWRADNRHTRAEDVRVLRALCDRRGAEFNLEGDDRDELIALAIELSVTQFTLVPVRPGEITSDHGWEVPRQHAQVTPVIERLRAHGIRTAMFMECVPASMAAAAATGVERVELYTEPYAAAFGTARQAAELERLRDTARAAVAAGMKVNAGHDLDLVNTPPIARDIPEIVEVSIGHALIADALYLGFPEAVTRYAQACRGEDVDAPITR